MVRALRREPLHGGVLEQAAERRDLLLTYLEQEEMLDGTPYGVVDIGWRGRPAAALSAVLTEVGATHPRRFYYFGLLTELPRRVRADRLGHLFDDGHRRGAGRHMESMATLDIFCAGREGLTVGYAEGAEGVEPVLRSPHNDLALAWGLPVLRDAVDSSARHLVLDADLVDLDADLRPAVLAVLTEFPMRPTDAEARAWDAFPHSSDQNEGDSYTLARPISVSAAARSTLRGVHYTDWKEGSPRISPFPAALLLGTPLRVTKRLRRTAKNCRGRAEPPRCAP